VKSVLIVERCFGGLSVLYFGEGEGEWTMVVSSGGFEMTNLDDAFGSGSSGCVQGEGSAWNRAEAEK
jgi:hypothetical protein